MPQPTLISHQLSSCHFLLLCSLTYLLANLLPLWISFTKGDRVPTVKWWMYTLSTWHGPGIVDSTVLFPLYAGPLFQPNGPTLGSSYTLGASTSGPWLLSAWTPCSDGISFMKPSLTPWVWVELGITQFLRSFGPFLPHVKAVCWSYALSGCLLAWLTFVCRDLQHTVLHVPRTQSLQRGLFKL